jgi:hypothetical protein
MIRWSEQIRRSRLQTGTKAVPVTIDKPRQQALPAQVDELRLVALKLQHIRFFAHRDDLAPSHSDSLGERVLVVHGDNITAMVDHVSRLRCQA